MSELPPIPPQQCNAVEDLPLNNMQTLMGSLDPQQENDMPSGHRCRSPRFLRKPRHSSHDSNPARSHQATGEVISDRRLHQLPARENRVSVQLALNEIIRGYIWNAIDARKADVLLCGLNIAPASVGSEEKIPLAGQKLAKSATAKIGEGPAELAPNALSPHETIEI